MRNRRPNPEDGRGPYCPECQYEFRDPQTAMPLARAGQFIECEGCGTQVRAVASFGECIDKPAPKASYVSIPGLAALPGAEAARRVELGRMKAALKRVRGMLLLDRDCVCEGCIAIIRKACGAWRCPTCGYAGAPSTAACTCGDYTCVPSRRMQASECLHGLLVCPVCDSGERRFGEAILDVVQMVAEALGEAPNEEADHVDD